jgi:hypothetical protein
MFPNSTSLTKLLVDRHIEDLRRSAARARLARASTDDTAKTIRNLRRPLLRRRIVGVGTRRV